jgi:hypothetical protein
MEFYNGLRLLKIKAQNVYFDRKSREASTGLVKPKYKLSGKVPRELDVFIFFPLTKNKGACSKYLSICVSKMEWENKNPQHLNECYSYISIRAVETIDQTELLQKINDNDNKFDFVARLPNNKFAKLKKLLQNIDKSSSYISPRDKVVIGAALSDGDAISIQKALQDLGL